MNLMLGKAALKEAESKTFIQLRRQPVLLAHLETYTMGNKALEREVLQLFKRQSLIYFDKLTHAADQVSWRAACSVLKASARSIGAWRLEMTAETAETFVFRKQHRERTRLLGLLAEQIDDAIRFIDRLVR